MSFRITSAKILIQLGEAIKSLAVVIMKPQDLIDFGKISYSKQPSINSFSVNQLVEDGLAMDEELLLNSTLTKSGKALILGVGGGREAIALSKIGFKVTATDFVEEMCQSALMNAKKYGVEIDVLTQELSNPDFPEETFDIVWLSTGMYSVIPTRNKRVQFLKRVRSILKPGGFFLFQFHWRDSKGLSKKKEAIKNIIGTIFFLNPNYETGDSLWREKEFVHFFPDLEKLKSELASSGMELILLEKHDMGFRGNAVLKKEIS